MTNERLRFGLCRTDVHDQARKQSDQVEASVEPISKLSKVAISLLAVFESFVGTR
jgi:hypothetical protein